MNCTDCKFWDRENMDSTYARCVRAGGTDSKIRSTGEVFTRGDFGCCLFRKRRLGTREYKRERIQKDGWKIMGEGKRLIAVKGEKRIWGSLSNIFKKLYGY